MSIVEDRDYQKCCDIIEKLGDLDSQFMEQILICLSANYKDVRDYIITNYCEILEEVVE